MGQWVYRLIPKHDLSGSCSLTASERRRWSRSMATSLTWRGPLTVPNPSLQRLPEHLLQIIVEMIYEDSQRFVPIDRREFLSIESFPPVQPDTSTLSSFRLVCRHFSELGLPYQFSRVTTRFSRQGFVRLDKISSCARAAKCTRRFVYMVPHFFVEGAVQGAPWEMLADDQKVTNGSPNSSNDTNHVTSV